MSKELIRNSLARNVARRYAAQLLQDAELCANAFDDEELSPAERWDAHAELRRLAAEMLNRSNGN